MKPWHIVGRLTKLCLIRFLTLLLEGTRLTGAKNGPMEIEEKPCGDGSNFDPGIMGVLNKKIVSKLGSLSHCPVKSVTGFVTIIHYIYSKLYGPF